MSLQSEINELWADINQRLAALRSSELYIDARMFGPGERPYTPTDSSARNGGDAVADIAAQYGVSETDIHEAVRFFPPKDGESLEDYFNRVFGAE